MTVVYKAGKPNMNLIRREMWGKLQKELDQIEGDLFRNLDDK